VRFFRVTELVTLLFEARDERALLGLKGRLDKLDLLVLDEFGYVPASKRSERSFCSSPADEILVHRLSRLALRPFLRAMVRGSGILDPFSPQRAA
jgi:hypothetical protein